MIIIVLVTHREMKYGIVLRFKQILSFVHKKNITANKPKHAEPPQEKRLNLMILTRIRQMANKMVIGTF